eukprot:824875-Pyramimonas_sp.AAC.1
MSQTRGLLYSYSSLGLAAAVVGWLPSAAGAAAVEGCSPPARSAPPPACGPPGGAASWTASPSSAPPAKFVPQVMSILLLGSSGPFKAL